MPLLPLLVHHAYGPRLEGKDIKQVKNFVYLGGNISENGEWMWRFDAECKQERMHGDT